MKLLIRILIILTAAAIISIIAIAVVNDNGLVQTALASLSGEGERLRRGSGNQDGIAPLFGGRHLEERSVGNMERYGLGSGVSGVSLLKNLTIIAAIVLIYWLAGKFVGVIRKWAVQKPLNIIET